LGAVRFLTLSKARLQRSFGLIHRKALDRDNEMPGVPVHRFRMWEAT
jgi:hypothetical protein